jgi:hypothetical protein
LQILVESHIEIPKFESKKIFISNFIETDNILCIIKAIRNQSEISMMFNFKKNRNSESQCSIFEDRYRVDYDDMTIR